MGHNKSHKEGEASYQLHLPTRIAQHIMLTYTQPATATVGFDGQKCVVSSMMQIPPLCSYILMFVRGMG